MTAANPGDVEKAATGWTSGQVFCRTNGHAWKDWTVRHSAKFRRFTVLQRCPRCKNKRQMVMNEQGYVLEPWRSVYEKGYLLPKGTGRIDSNGRAVLRIIALADTKVIEEVDEDG